MPDPASEALRISRNFLKHTLEQNEVDFKDIEGDCWRIFGVNELLRKIAGEDHPVVRHLDTARKTLLAGAEVDERQALRSALEALPEHWEPSTPDPGRRRPFDGWLRYRAWLSTRPWR